MSLANDPQQGPDNPSPISRRMTELKDAVFALWEKRVLAEISEAASLPRPILIDTLPAFYFNLARSLTPGYPNASVDAVKSSVALEHGGERARLTRYRAENVIAEYQILRSSLLEVLEDAGCLPTREELMAINTTFDMAIREAATAFTLTQAAFREHFVAALVHDIRSPLANAHSGAQLISLAGDLNEARTFADKIRSNLERLDMMVKEMLDAVVFQHGARLNLRPTHFDVVQLVREICADTPRNTSARLQIAGDVIQGWWDRDLMKRALENLVGNAMKYGYLGSVICISMAEYSARLKVSVHNDGEPIPADQIETVFQVFRRAQAARESGSPGWGIGLPFVRSVAESHGGSIDLDSSAERGTTFSIDVPLDCRPFLGAPTTEAG